MKKRLPSEIIVAVILFLAAIFIVPSCTLDTEDEPIEPLVGSVIDYDIVVPTTLTADKTWIIDGFIYVSADLIIEPGTVIKFKEDAALAFSYSGNYSSLTALGTADKPILFTSEATVSSKGDYLGLLFFDKTAKSSKMEYCTIEYAGSTNGYDAAIYIFGTEITLNNCIVRKSATAGVYCDGYSKFVSCSANLITDCDDYPMVLYPLAVHTLYPNNVFEGKGVSIISGELENLKVTWPKFVIPYYVDDIYIQEDAELTLTPGTVLKFHANGAILVAWNGTYGKLLAEGTVELPIVFTSAANSPSKGDWAGLSFFEKTIDGSNMQNCIINYGGSSNWYSANIYASFCADKLSVIDCQINNSSSCGIRTNVATPVLSGNSFEGNVDDICVD